MSAGPVALPAAESRRGWLLGLLDEVARRNTDQEQERSNDRRRADELDGLVLRLDATDDVEERAGADEIDPFDIAHVHRHDAVGMHRVRELAEPRGKRPGHHSRPLLHFLL